jgi:alpha-amylase
VGAGAHRRLQERPYVFSRTFERDGVTDRVVVGLSQGDSARTIPVGDVFPDGTELIDSYSGVTGTVANGRISLTSGFGLVLLAERR